MLSFDDLSASDPRPILLLDNKGIVLARNGAAARAVTGLAIASPLDVISPSQADFSVYLQRCASSRGPLPASLTLRDHQGVENVWRSDGGVVRPAELAHPAMIILRLRPSEHAHVGFISLKEKIAQLNLELEHRKFLQAELERALGAAEMLLAEVNHRVKNNLQIIVSMLGMASREAEPAVAIRRTQERIAAMAHVQDIVYASKNFTDIDFRQLLNSLCEAIKQIHGREDVKVIVDCANIKLAVDRAMTLALLVNELVSNAYKHAFPVGVNGHIVVRFFPNTAEQLELLVADDGQPMPALRKSGTGLMISRGLAAKLGGGLAISVNPKEIRVSFPINEMCTATRATRVESESEGETP